MSFMDYQFWVADILRLFPCWPDVPTISSFPGGMGRGGEASSTYGCPGLRCKFSVIFLIWDLGEPTLGCKLPTIFVIEVSQFEIRDESLIGLFGSEPREGQRVELRKLSFKRHR